MIQWVFLDYGRRTCAGECKGAHAVNSSDGLSMAPGASDRAAATHAQLISTFVHATTSGDLNALMRLLASDVRVVTDDRGRSRRHLNVVEGSERAARFLVDATGKHAGAWWRDDCTLRFSTINGLPGVIVDGPDGPVQTAAFEIEDEVIRALFVVCNSDKFGIWR